MSFWIIRLDSSSGFFLAFASSAPSLARSSGVECVFGFCACRAFLTAKDAAPARDAFWDFLKSKPPVGQASPRSGDVWPAKAQLRLLFFLTSRFCSCSQCWRVTSVAVGSRSSAVARLRWELASSSAGVCATERLLKERRSF